MLRLNYPNKLLHFKTFKGLIMASHNFSVIVFTLDGMPLAKHTDFDESAMWEFFDDVVRDTPEDYVVQLCEGSNVLAEEIL